MTQLQFNDTIVQGKYTIFKEIGQGANGKVYLGCESKSGRKVAIKQIEIYKLSQSQVEVLHNEIRLHTIMSQHKNVVKLLQSHQTKDYLYIIMEYCRQGDMFDYIVKLTNQDRIEKINYHRNLALDLIETVMDCHLNSVFHRDLKPENVLLSEDTLKLADFGLATQHDTSNYLGCGSSNYMAPEAFSQSINYSDFEENNINNFAYSTIKSDIWSIGIILVNLFCGLNPWAEANLNDNAFFDYYNDSNYLYHHLSVTQQFYEILLMCLHPDPNCRADLNQIYTAIYNCKHFLRSELPCTPIELTKASEMEIMEFELTSNSTTFSDSNSESSCKTLSSDIPTNDTNSKFLEDRNHFFQMYFSQSNLDIDPIDLS